MDLLIILYWRFDRDHTVDSLRRYIWTEKNINCFDCSFGGIFHLFVRFVLEMIQYNQLVWLVTEDVINNCNRYVPGELFDWLYSWWFGQFSHFIRG